ncbi:MAG: hypothetical protein K6A61_05695 [Butyrivibrio sp.]|nr:hypothetical protein [Butyrivibrio sp.]
MFIVTVLTIIAWECIVAMFAFLLHVIPLKNYYKNIVKVQLFLSSSALILGLFVHYYVKMNYDSGIFYGSKWDDRGEPEMVILFLTFFICSLIHFVADKKNSRNKIETFVLRADEYKIVKDVEYLYMPTVKNYCEFDRGIIAFSGNMPNREIDGTFTCRMVKDGIYECFEYKALSGENNKLSFLRIKQIIIWLLGAIDVVLVGIWISQAPQMHIDVVTRFLPGLSLILFGTMLIEILKGNKGLFPKIMIAFSIFFIIAGIKSFFG